MRRRTFLSALPVGVLATTAAQAQQPAPASAPPSLVSTRRVPDIVPTPCAAAVAGPTR